MVAVSVVLLLFVVAILTFAIWKEKNLRSRNVGIPAAPGVLYLGALFDVIKNKDRIHDYYLDNFIKYGTAVKYTLIGRDQILLTGPQDVKHVLQSNFNNYPKGPHFHHIMEDFFGDGIFNADGENWRVQRKEASTLFHFENLTSSVLNVFSERAQACLKIFEQHQNSKQEIEVQTVFMRYTMDSIAEVGFGYPINSLEGGSDSDGTSDFVKAFDYVNEQTNDRFMNDPIWKIVQHKNSKFHRQVKIMNDFVLKIIEKRRKSMQEASPSDAAPQDLLGIFLKVQDSNNHFSDRYLLDVTKNFVIAGRDTTALCLTWTCYWISQNPQVEKKLIDELKAVFSGYDKSKKLVDVITPEKLGELKYMRNVIDESLRLSPPVPLDGKWCLEDDTLPSGITVTGGTLVGYAIYSIHRDPALWKEPLKFNPERWVTDTIKPYQFIAFNAGPRVCLGMNMAYLEVKVLLSALLLNYQLPLVKGHDASYKPALTLFAKNGMKMNVVPRN